MQSPEPSKIFAYAIAAVTLSAGVALVTGLLDFEVPSRVRYTFGAVLMLMGVYRFIVTRLQPKPSKWRRFTNVDEE
jgi:hypothetical protein